MQLETLANVFAATNWPGGSLPTRSFTRRPDSWDAFAQISWLSAAQPAPDAQAYLLDEFQRDLTVQTIPRTLVLQIRFRSHDAALSAAVVNALIRAYNKQDTEERVAGHAMRQPRGCTANLSGLKARVDRDDRAWQISRSNMES